MTTQETIVEAQTTSQDICKVLLAARMLAGQDNAVTMVLLMAAVIDMGANCFGMSDEQILRSLEENLQAGVGDDARAAYALRVQSYNMGRARGQA